MYVFLFFGLNSTSAVGFRLSDFKINRFLGWLQKIHSEMDFQIFDIKNGITPYCSSFYKLTDNRLKL